MLDLTGRQLAHLKILHTRFPSRTGQDKWPWQIVLASANVLNRLDGLHRCARLRKLDLSHNSIVELPNQNFWRCLPRLQSLQLHANKIDSIHALQELAVLPELTILTCYGLLSLTAEP